MRCALALAAAALPLALVACGPVTVEQAERQCFDQARLAERPRGEVALGAASGGRAVGRVDVTVSSDFLLRRDPAEVWESCVVSRSGQLPRRPYSSLPDTRGSTDPRRRG